MGTTAEKLTYLNDTKQLLKENINSLGGNLTNEPFRQYASVLEGIYERIPKVSGIGASLSLSPTMVGKIKLNEIDGDTLQDGTPTPDTPVEIQNVTGLQNINVCGKNLFNKDNIIKLNGTIDNGNNTFVGGGLNYAVVINCKPNTTYTVQKRNDGNTNRFALASSETIPSTTGSEVTAILNKIREDNSSSLTLTTGATAKYLIIQYYRSAESVLTEQQLLDSIQAEIGSTATEYEEYKVNTYEVNLGKNLFNGTLYQGQWGDDGVFITSTRRITNVPQNNTSSFLLKKGTYTLSINDLESCTMYTKNSNGNFIDKFSNAWHSLPFTFTLTQDGYLYFTARKNDNTVLTPSDYNVQIEKGSTATSYSPYFTPIELNKIEDYEDSIKKSTGKNLCNSKTINSYAGSTGNINTSASNQYLGVSDKIVVEPNTTYTITFFSYDTGSFNYATYDKNGNFIERITNTSKTFTTGATVYYVFPYLYQNSGPYTTINTNVQLEQGSTSTEYEPYGKVWYIEKQIGKVILNGSENWGLFFSTNGVFLCNTLITSINNATAINCISNYFSNTYSRSYIRSHLDSVDNVCATNGGELILANKAITSINDFKTWLSNNNTTVYYVLDTSTTTEITNTTLIEQLDNLYTAKSCDGTTNIAITSENLPMIINASALKGDAE